MKKKLINKLSINLFLIILFTLLVSSSVFASDYEEQELIYNKLYDNTHYFKTGDTQSFYVNENIVVTNVKLIVKTEYEVDAYDDMQLYIKNHINGSMAETLAVTNNTNSIKRHFREINFDFNGVGLTKGRYWIDTAGSSYLSYYSDTSQYDTYINGAINNESGNKDVYFVISGYKTINNTEIKPVVKEQSINNQIFGTDSIIRFISAFIIMFALITYTKGKLKNDYLVVAVSILSAVSVYMLSLINFYYAGLFVVADLIFMFTFRGETTK